MKQGSISTTDCSVNKTDFLYYHYIQAVLTHCKEESAGEKTSLWRDNNGISIF